jgi:hypothetical protein
MMGISFLYLVERTPTSNLKNIKGVFGGEVACVFLSKKHVFIAFKDMIYA